MGQMTVEQWYGTIKTGLTKKLTENKEALPAGFNQQRFILNCITVIQDMMKDDKKKAQLEKINPETIPVCLAKAAYLGLDFFNGECYAIPYGGTVDQFIANVCEEKIGKIVIPEKKSTWSDEVTYKPLSEYVGERFELFLTEKRYDRDGRIASYSSDRKLSAAGLLTSQYLEEELGKKVEKLIANAKREVEESLIKSLEQNLKENLAKDTIERMNIPEALKKLSSIGAKQVTGTSLPE